ASPELRPWEEPGQTTTFRLRRVEGTTAWFSGLTLHRDDDDLIIHLAMRSTDGEVMDVEFRAKRATL
ncbi:MAG: hypothetical protein KDB61_06830, partial [Planctomycetes bacterium]|nr:hypothetical protein [Planctomycetota bacterium]